MRKITDFLKEVEGLFNIKIDPTAKDSISRSAKYVFVKSCLEYGIELIELKEFFGHKKTETLRLFVLRYNPSIIELEMIKKIVNL